MEYKPTIPHRIGTWIVRILLATALLHNFGPLNLLVAASVIGAGVLVFGTILAVAEESRT